MKSRIFPATQKQKLIGRFAHLSPRMRIIFFAGVPMTIAVVWSIFSAMGAPKVEAPIERNLEPLVGIYADPMYSFQETIGIPPGWDRGNLDAQTNDVALGHLARHGEAVEELLTNYEQSLLLSSEVAKIRELARKEIEAGGDIATDKIGDVSHAACLQRGTAREDCIYLRLMGDGLARMGEAHRTGDYQQFIDGKRVYMAALAALGDYTQRSPDFQATQTTLQTYRKAIAETVELNRMWIGETEPLSTGSPVRPQDLRRRIENTMGD